MNWIEEASQVIGVPLRRHGTQRAVGPCPYCEQAHGDGGDDRFVVFPEGNYWCNQCHQKGWWIEEPPTADVVKKRLQDKAEQTQAAYLAMHDNKDWIAYNNAVKAEIWADRGINQDSIDQWGLGFCESAPYTDPPAPSITIPIFYGQKLYDIRHRVLGGAKSQKYRSHLSGIVPIFFNLDNLCAGKQVYLVEGEIKAIYLMQLGIGPIIAYPGVQYINYLPALAKRHKAKGIEFIAIPDPGTTSHVTKYLEPVAELGNLCSVVELIDKPDDFTAEYGLVCMKDAIRFRRKL